jgi:hypothetical protein
VLESQRKQIEESVRLAKTTSETTQRQLAEQMQSHVGALTSLSTASTGVRRARRAGEARCQALPNPGERLVGLWDGVRSLENTLT